MCSERLVPALIAADLSLKPPEVARFGISPRGDSHIDLLPVALVLVVHGALQDLGGQVARRATDLCEDRAERPPEPPRRGCAISAHP